MTVRGINYDTGVLDGPAATRRAFDPDVVRREMRVVAHDLHCTTVRVTGTDSGRLSVAGQAALDAGLELWFSPFPIDVAPHELLAFLTECAERAEHLRRQEEHVTLVLGCESSLFCKDFLPGDTMLTRLATMTSPPWPAPFRSAFAALPDSLNQHLAEAVAQARRSFGGPITYAAGTWEPVNWAPFDLVAVDLYRDQINADHYRDQVRAYLAHDKPVAITEFGCCTYDGAADRGGLGFTIFDPTANPPCLDGIYQRSEQEQADYFCELFDLFGQEGVHGAFWFTFAGYELPHRPDPLVDLDLASYGAVKILDTEHTAGGRPRWEPKQVFHAIATAYADAEADVPCRPRPPSCRSTT